jgi:hypothetical protein
VTENDIATHLLASATRGEPVAHRFESGTATESFRRELRAKARTQQIQIRTAVFNDTLLVIALNDAEFWHEPVTTIRNTLLLAG